MLYIKTRKIVFVGQNLTSLIFIVFLAKYVPFFSITISTQISTVALEKSRSEIMAKLPSSCSPEIIRQLFGMRAHIMRPINEDRTNERTSVKYERKSVAVLFTYLFAKFYDAKISTDGGTHLCSRPLSALARQENGGWKSEKYENLKWFLNSSILPACVSPRISLRQIPQMEILFTLLQA